MRSTRIFPFALLLAACGPRVSRVAVVASDPNTPPALSAITEDDLRRDLFALAGDSMRGREAGSLDELRASAWLGERLREAGLRPAGDDGTYFQFWPMRRVRTAAASRIALDDGALALGADVVVVAPVQARVSADLVFVGEGREADVASVDLRGKAVAAVISPPSNPPPAGVSLREFRYARAAIVQRVAFLAGRGAAAVVLVSDSVAESAWGYAGSGMLRGRYNVDSSGTDQPAAGPPVLWVRRALLDRVRAARRLDADVIAESFVYPSVNVVAVVPGTDPALRGQYVLYSAHQDHDGVRHAVGGDSIWNGADDNATVAVSVLAIGRALARRPARRSSLFVWHGAEERGLLGSRWYVAHPTVPRDSIVAVLNGDMIGRNHPDSAALLGAQPPHRNSSALVQMALDANARLTRFAIDSSWDRPAHPEGWYFRSDHLPYARAGIPALFFTTLLHPDYHTPRDEPQRIDVAKLARMTRWMYATGWTAGNANERPRVDAGTKLER
ncbi:MAG TPA: M28 family peptidase [Gemmatimonadaceae bacterium]|nr:M28 family peptidase [Gemmatimonadaceae bacterium]